LRCTRASLWSCHSTPRSQPGWNSFPYTALFRSAMVDHRSWRLQKMKNSKQAVAGFTSMSHWVTEKWGHVIFNNWLARRQSQRISDREGPRLNSTLVSILYAVVGLIKKKRFEAHD